MAFTKIAALLVSLLCSGAKPASASILYPPSVPQPKYAADIVGFNLQNTAASPLPAQYVTFGQAFKDGAVPNTATLIATVNGQTEPVQMDVKTSFARNTVKKWPSSRCKLRNSRGAPR